MSNPASIETKTAAVKGGRWAPTQNLLLCSRALERAMNREPNLPGIVSFSGPSGWGKSMAASYCMTKFQGFYVECRSYFTKKSFVEAILKDMSVRPASTLSRMMEQVVEQLDLSQRPLIIDEADHIVDRHAIEILRDLHEMSRTTILLIGEEQFPRKLLKHERFHNRVLVWELAQPANTDDARKLAGFYCPDITIDAALLDRVCEVSRNTARRICVNLDMIRNHCQTHGLKKIGLEDWGKRAFYSGEAPARRPQ